MCFIQNMYEYKKVFRDIEKLSKKCDRLKCDINIIYPIYKVIYKILYIYIYCVPYPPHYLVYSDALVHMSHTFSACDTVRGKPSSRKPLAHSGLARFVRTSSKTKSLLISFPVEIIRFTT